MKRDMKKFLYSPMLSKSIDAETGKKVFRYAFTSENMDEGGDIIEQAATVKATEDWRQWRNIRMQHDPKLPIGKAVGIGKKDGMDWNHMDVRIDDLSKLPLIDGPDPTLGGASVGILVNEYETNDDPEAIARNYWGDPWIITDYTMIEISLVDHPANYDAKRVSESDDDKGRRGRCLFMQRDISNAIAPDGEEPEEKGIEVDNTAGEHANDMPGAELPESDPEPIEEKELVTNLLTGWLNPEEKDIEAAVPSEPLEIEDEETPPENTKQEGGDPVLDVLTRMEEKLDVLSEMIERGFKAIEVKDTHTEEQETITPNEVEQVEIEDAAGEPADTEISESLDGDSFDNKVESKKIQETELEDVVQKMLQRMEVLFEQKFNVLFEAKMEELKMLKPRKSKAVDPDAQPEVQEKESQIALTPRETLFSGVRKVINNMES